jgi:hypothetical protein
MIRKLISVALALAIVANVGAIIAPKKALAATTTKSTTAKTTVVAKDPYAYTARSGDSYSVLARKAVQTYGIREKVNLTQAQIIAAETFLTSDAGFPALNLAQSVTFDKTVVKAAIVKAQALSATSLALWQTYVKYVDFDTRDNG